MKTLGISLVLMFWSLATTAQEVTVLDEARIFAPASSEVNYSGDSFSFMINESYAGEFEQDPLLFMNNYFEINDFITEVAKKDFDSYQVAFRSTKGSLKAEFDKQGNLVKTSQKFKNIIIPDDLRHQLYRDHKGWTMVKNTHIAKGKKGLIEKNFYRIKLENGGQTKRIKLDGRVSEEVELASN